MVADRPRDTRSRPRCIANPGASRAPPDPTNASHAGEVAEETLASGGALHAVRDCVQGATRTAILPAWRNSLLALTIVSSLTSTH